MRQKVIISQPRWWICAIVLMDFRHLTVGIENVMHWQSQVDILANVEWTY
jgi:hypothetical protein